MKRKRQSQGGRAGNQKKRRLYKQPQRAYVPRTMGPFANSESKYFDSYKYASAIIAAGATTWAGTEQDPATLDTLFVPQEGSDIDNRIGRKVSVYKIALRGLIQTATLNDSAYPLGAPWVRLILYVDQQTNGVQSQGEDLMATAGNAATTPLVFQNLANLGRFRVLKDMIIRPSYPVVGTDGAATVAQDMADIPFKITIKLKTPIVVKFNGLSGGSVGDIVDNSFHLLGMKSSDQLTYYLSYQCRAYYKDM